MAIELSNKKQKWLDERFRTHKGYISGRPIVKSAHSDVFYRTAMDRELRRYIDAVLKALESEYSNTEDNLSEKDIKRTERVLNGYSVAMIAILLANSKKIINKWLGLTQKDVAKSVRSMAFDLAGKTIALKKTKAYDDVLRIIVDRNARLITNIAEQARTNIENIVYDGILAREKWSTIRKALKHQTEVSAKRMKTIARDQTAKAREAINRQEQQALGIEYFRWLTVGDERVSKEHRKLNGKIYKWGDIADRLPEIDSYGNKGYPSDRVNCRCSAVAIIILDGYKAVWDNGTKSYKVVKDVKL